MMSDSAVETTTQSDQELLMKHPLQHKWVLWFRKNDRRKTWEETLIRLTTFDTVEDFWSIYNHIRPCNQISNGCDYYLFKDGIRPAWEDPRCTDGGYWKLIVPASSRNNFLERYWLELLLCLVGESFDEFSDEILGAVVSCRKSQDRVELWTAHWKAKEAVLSIGNTFKSRLSLNNSKLEYFPFNNDKAEHML